MSTTLLQLRTLTRYLIDEFESSSKITWSDAELLEYINDEQRWLWAYLSKQDDSFGLREATRTTTQGQTNYLYPSDISGNAIRAIYAYVTATDPQEKIQKGSIEEVVALGITQSDPDSSAKFACLDGYFQLGPPPGSTAYTLRIYYNRVPTLLSADSDTMESADIYKEVIATGAAIRALKRIDRDTQKLELKRGELLQDAARANSPEDLMQVVPAWKY